MSRPSPPPPAHYPNVGNMLAELNPDEMRSDQKREGQDWYAVFNPNVRRVLDIELVCNLGHESVVCCVRFSHDGTKVATGCNRSAQIFDVATGNKLTTLQDDSVDKDGDLYIRSVCFSPDGTYLATGAEDKQIRVRLPAHPSQHLAILTDAGLGYRESHDSSHVCWSWAGHLFLGLRAQRAADCLGQRWPYGSDLGYCPWRWSLDSRHRRRCYYGCYITERRLRGRWFAGQECTRLGNRDGHCDGPPWGNRRPPG